MPNMDDFHAFRSTTDGSSGGAGCSLGCLSPGVVVAIVVVFIIYLIGRLC